MDQALVGIVSLVQHIQSKNGKVSLKDNGERNVFQGAECHEPFVAYITRVDR